MDTPLKGVAFVGYDMVICMVSADGEQPLFRERSR